MVRLFFQEFPRFRREFLRFGPPGILFMRKVARDCSPDNFYSLICDKGAIRRLTQGTSGEFMWSDCDSMASKQYIATKIARGIL